MLKKSDLLIYLFISLVLFILKLAIHSYIEAYISLLAVFFFLLSCIYFVIKNKQSKIFIVALVFTFISDCLLSGFGSLTTLRLNLALSTFVIAQTCYLLVLLKCSSIKVNKICVYTRLVLFSLLLLIAFIMLKDKMSYLIVLSLLYVSILVFNCVQAFFNTKTYKTLGVGFVFFLLCDLIIGITFIFENELLPADTNSFLYKFFMFENSINLQWLFYIISLCLIVLSIALNNDVSKKKQ